MESMLKKKRLLMVQTQAENAGAQEISRLLGNELSDRGYDVHHLFFFNKSDAHIPLENVHISCDVRPSNPLSFVYFLGQLRKQIKEIAPDCVLTFQHYGNIFGAPMARLAGIENVIANHVSAKATMNGAVRAIDKFLGVAGVYRLMTVNSHDLAKDYAGYPDAYKNRVCYVPHGFEDKQLQISKLDAREMFSLPQDAKIAGCVARLHALKQIDLLIPLLKRDEELHVAVLGQGPEQENLTEAANAAGVLNRFHLVGERDPSEVGAFLNCLDVFAFPSAAETFGLAAVEAAQAGIPVVANTLPVLEEVLAFDGKPCAQFVDVKDGTAFSKAVSEVLSQPDLAQKLSERGKMLKERYSLSAMVDAYEALIESREIENSTCFPIPA